MASAMPPSHKSDSGPAGNQRSRTEISLDSPKSPAYSSLSPRCRAPQFPQRNRSPIQSQGDHMRHVLAAVLCIAIPIAMFASEMFASEKDNGYKVTYDG